MDIYDSHTHLNQLSLFQNREHYFSSFLEIWWKGLVNAWANQEYNLNGINIAKICKERYPDCYVKCAIGRHPCDIQQLDDNLDLEKQNLKQQILENKEFVVAIGECWIDLHYEEAQNVEEQQKYFKAQCELAQELWLPIMIHSRDAFQETYDVLKQFPNITVYIHCWGYWEKEIQLLLKTFPNLYIWFCWNITYKSAENLRESLKILPIEKLLVETDAPYLSPQGHRWEINEPKNVIVIWKYISELLRIEEETLWKQVCTNFFNLYKNK